MRCRFSQVNRLLGIEVPPEAVKKIFVGLGLKVVSEGRASARPSVGGGGHAEAWPSDDFVEVESPTFRVDLEREADLIEEVCRIHGVEKIPSRMQPSTPTVSEFDAQWDARRRVREVLTALGFHEAMNQTLVESGRPDKTVGAPAFLRLQNPLSVDQGVLRSSLVPGLLANLRTNVSRHQYDVKLFEIGRVFAADGQESLHLALAATGRRNPDSWEAVTRDAQLDLYDLKGALEELAENLAAPSVAAVEIRQISPAQAKKHDLRDAVYVAEMELDPVLAAVGQQRRSASCRSFPRWYGTWRWWLRRPCSTVTFWRRSRKIEINSWNGSNYLIFSGVVRFRRARSPWRIR